MKNLFSIGDLSKLQNISRQTLIFYDKIGLFCPAYVDPENGYRYYSAAQLDFLDTICIMKRIGFSLDEIKSYLKEYTLDTSMVALRKQLTIIDRQIEELQLIKSRVEHRCLQLEQSAAIRSQYAEVSVQTVQSQYIVWQEVAAPYTLDRVSMATKQCFVRSFKERLPVFFQSGAIVPLARILRGEYTLASHAFLPIEKCSAAGVVELPAGQCAVTYHTGDYLSIGTAYERLLQYCRAHRLQIISDSYEFALIDYLSTGDEAEYITKILFYVEDAP